MTTKPRPAPVRAPTREEPGADRVPPDALDGLCRDLTAERFGPAVPEWHPDTPQTTAAERKARDQLEKEALARLRKADDKLRRKGHRR